MPNTITALATPFGESALAVIRITGSLCKRLCKICLNKNLFLKPRYVMLCEYKLLLEKPIDNCLAVYYPYCKSYTGEEMLELYFHGNPLIIKLVLEDLQKRGCKLAEPGEFTRKAFLNGKIDLTQAEAIADLINARSEKAINIASKLLGGGLKREIEIYQDRILEILSIIEGNIDFTEAYLQYNNNKFILNELIYKIDILINSKKYKNILQKGINIVITGAPNAGKSRLFNKLIGEDKAIISPIPGTTRDVVSRSITIGPYISKCYDTAGIFNTKNSIDLLSIRKTQEQLLIADYILLVIDPTSKSSIGLKENIANINTIIIENKIDLLKFVSIYEIKSQYLHIRNTSIKVNSVIKDYFLHVLEHNSMLSRNDNIIINTRQENLLSNAKNQIISASNYISNTNHLELAAIELRSSIETIGSIIGRIDNEMLLDKLFSSFCIGK